MKLFFENEGETKAFSDKHSWENYYRKCALQEMLKVEGSFQDGDVGHSWTQPPPTDTLSLELLMEQLSL